MVNNPLDSRSARASVAVLFVIAVLILLGTAYFYNRYERRRIEDEKHETVQAIGELKAVQVSQWRRDFMAKVNRSVSGPFFVKALVAWQGDPGNQGLREAIYDRLRKEKEAVGLANAFFVSRAGMVTNMAAFPADADFSDATERAVQEALTGRDPVLSDIFKGASGETFIDAVAAVRDSRNGILGLMVLRCNPKDQLFPMIQHWPTPSLTAESLLVRREGNEIVFLNPSRHEKHAPLALRVPITRTDVPAVQAVLGKQGVCQGKDYRGVEVLSDLRPVPGSPWFMVGKVDVDEILAEARYRSGVTAGFLFVGILLAAAMASLFYRKRQAGLFMNLYQSACREREAQEEFRATLYSIGDAVITTDREGRIMHVNPVAGQLTGWTEKECIGKPLEEIFKITEERSGRPAENPAEKVLREQCVVELSNHTVLTARDGTERAITKSAAPIRNAAGEITGVVLVFRDRTRERKAESALRESERRYRTLADSGTALVWTASTDKKCDYFNQPWLTFTGRTMEQERGDGWAEGVHPDDLNRCFGVYSTAFDRRVPFSMVYRLTRHDGEYRWIHDQGVPRYDTTGAFLGYIGHCMDITPQKIAEQEREILERQLRQSQKMEAVGRLAGGVAHDFNNMLQVIKGYAEVLLVNTDPADPKAADLREILNGARRSSDLTRQLLAFARKQTIDPRLMDVNDTVGDMIKMLGRLIGEDTELAWNPAPQPCCIKMDSTQIDQILTNLVVNARDAISGSGGRIVIETVLVQLDAGYCQLHEGSLPGAYVRLSVSDTGGGMDKDTAAHLFEPFFTTKAQGKGTGLGLATVYGIVKQNKGLITVYSEIGQGTTFKIYLPIVEGAVIPGRDPVAADDGPLAPGTVLLVEDEQILLALVRRLLEHFGFTVLAASGPLEALKKAEAHAGVIDLLLTDVIMPDMSGRELWKRLAVSRPACKVLFMSGYTANVIDHQGLLDEGVHFLEKPFSKQALGAKLRELLSAPA